MKTFISGGVKFYMLEEGELYPDPYGSNNFVGAYVIFPYEGSWLAQIHGLKTWENFTEETFDTANAAFNSAYEHYLSKRR